MVFGLRYSFSFLVTLCSVIVGCSSTPASQVMVGREAPLAQLYRITGDQVTLEQYQGKPVVLLFWAQWCSRSRGFISALGDVAADLKSRGVELVAVNIDAQDKLKKIEDIIESNGLENIDHMFSGNDVADPAFIAFGAREVPTVFILDKHHRVVAVGNSFDTVEEYYGLE
jgi:thiol-disulfide isomerase/thioredoxin